MSNDPFKAWVQGISDQLAEKRDPNPQPLTPGQQAILDAVPLVESFRSAHPRITNVWDEMAKAQADSTPKILAAWDKLAENGMPFAATASTATTASPTTFDLAAMEKLLAEIPPEPIGEWMRGQGFPPETSLLLLPETVRGQLPAYAWPRYVRFSVDVSSPTLCMDLMKHPVSQEYGQRYRK